MNNLSIATIEFLEKVKNYAQNYYGGSKRMWLSYYPLDSYRDQGYRIIVYVLEGSPPKSVILYSTAHKQALLFDNNLKLIKRFNEIGFKNRSVF